MIDRVECLLQVNENEASVFSFIYIQLSTIGASHNRRAADLAEHCGTVKCLYARSHSLYLIG